jgi:LysR family transcriptional regulator, low CO2-responsive transcriptional regulator
MTQPAVSQHIADLEAQLGATLFSRARRGVILTAEGETLHGYTLQILRLLAEAENAVTDVRKLSSGQLAMGATPGLSSYLLPDYLQAFRAQFPQITVTLQTGITSQILGELQAGRIAFGLIEGELDGVVHAQLGVLALEEVEQLVVVGPKHPWWTRPQISLAELNEQTFIMRQPNSQTRIWLEQTLRQHQIQPTVKAEFDNVESIKRMVTLGLCVTILPDYVVSHEVAAGLVHALRIEHAPLQRTLKLVWDKELPFTPVARAFLRHLQGKFGVLATVIG